MKLPVPYVHGTRRGSEKPRRGWRRDLLRSATCTGLGCATLLSLGHPGIQARLGAGPALALASVQSERLNQQDETDIDRGYYEGLLNAQSFISVLHQAQSLIPQDWEKGLHELGAVASTDDWLKHVLVPSQDVVFKQARFQTNRWGMRDRDYALAKPPGTYRVALLGSSHAMGWGVSNEEVFEALVEGRLNGAGGPGGHDAYEILNFAVQGYSLLQNVTVLEENASRFGPDAAAVVTHPNEVKWTLDQTAARLAHDLPVPYPELADLLRKAGVGPGLDRPTVLRRLMPYADELIAWGYGRLVASCHAHGIRPVWVYLPRPQDSRAHHSEPERLRLTRLAEEAGFLVLSLEGLYDGYDETAFYLAPWDKHPNPAAHRLIADRLYEVLLEHDDVLGLRSSYEETPPTVSA